MAEQLLHVVALGCPKNRVDVESVVALARAEGFALTDEPSKADAILVATCGFISPACQESVNTALELSEYRKLGARLVVSGCLSQRYGLELAEALPEADYVIGTTSLERIVDALAGRGPRLGVEGAGSDISSVARRLPLGKPAMAYLKVADGCSRKCAFCTIPSIRGGFRSRPIDELCDEARDLARGGVKELNLVAQDLTSYGRDRQGIGDLASLLRALGRVDGLRWIRPLYLYPEARLIEVMEVMALTPSIVPYLDLPIQHGSDTVLCRMKRGHRARLLREILAEARRLIPDVFLRTTVIVGHPGEGDDEFRELLDLVIEIEFEHLGAFRYSPEEGTTSFDQDGEVSGRASYNRYRKVMAVQRKISRRKCAALRGQTLEVLVEGPSEDSPLVYVGRHSGQAPDVDGLVYLDQPVDPGHLVQVRITDSGDYDLYGEVL